MSERDASTARRARWLARLGGWLIRLLASTWRVRYVKTAAAAALHASERPFVFSLWHGEMLGLLWAFRNEGAAILISEHGDGEVVAQAAIGLGYRTVRGSSSRGADRALLGLTRELQERKRVAVTPDGPRGPRHSYAPGALIVAQRADVPIVPVRAIPDRTWRLRSWDRFEIPKPFARVTILMADPAWVGASTAREAAERTEHFRALMDAAGALADG